MAAVAAPHVNANQNYVTWFNNIGTEARDFIHLDINGNDYTNYVVAAQRALKELAYAASFAASTAAVFALTSTLYSPQGAATIIVASSVSILIAQLATTALANRFPDSTVAKVAYHVLPLIAGITATIMTGNAVGIPIFSWDYGLRFLAATVPASLVSNLITFPVISRGVEIALNQIPDMGRRTVRVTAGLFEERQEQDVEARTNIISHPNQWRQFVNQYAIDHFNPERPNRYIGLPFNPYIEAALALE